ncbi:MAG: UDP-N-acetylmuramoyl-tripeptide--D-alanyl-D-alanine ligase, partial [Bacteroidetes bacterium]|nr:UDP-N-acetylmuramoyl-tripeptide--D-alanyl-D-alanine ligase [Bacteroidota bacterium]
SIFFALKGKNFNANEFADKALESGASYVVIDEEQYRKDERYILVDDVLKSLQTLARMYRDSFEIPVIGITGSNGKTTTKELLKAVLSTHFKTHVTQGNLNNHIGVPLTILSMPKDTQVAVIEMGANKVGDNEELCDIFNPNMGIITNIGKEHLEGFGNLEGVAKGNSELYAHLLKVDGLAFVNAEDELLMRMSSRLSKRKTYAVNAQADYICFTKKINPSIEINFNHQKINSSLFGIYNAENIAASIAIASNLGVPPELLPTAIENYIPSNNRSQIIKKDGNIYIVDCYNANPTSMELAIRNLMQSDFQGKRKIVMLGDMFEMGDYEEIEHNRIAALLTEVKPDAIYICGKAFRKQLEHINSLWFETSAELRNYIDENPIYDSVILLKGSRGMKMEAVIND